MSNGRTHRPERNSAVCFSCGGCTWQCPATVFPSLQDEEDSLRGEIYRARPFAGEKASSPPCVLACPLGQDVPGYMGAIAGGRMDEAAEIIRRTNALPSVCGRVCLASCMRACTRAGIDEGLDIRGIKRFAVHATAGAYAKEKSRAADGEAVVAIVGAGPAGLAAAHRLLQLGLGVHVFDEGAGGGSLADTVPSFVMPRKTLAADVEGLERMGMKTSFGVRVGRDISWEQLEKDFGAVLVATGARRGLKPSLKGADLEGVIDAVTFCRGAGEDGRKVAGNVVVAGGGFTAVLAARTALRLGADKASVVHPAPLEQWPCGVDAIAVARREGVELLDMHRVARLEGDGGTLATVGVKMVKASNPDPADRHTLASYGSLLKLEANTFVSSVDRRPGAGDAPKLSGIRLGVIGNVVVDREYALGRGKWFAAGEAATGAATVVDSMGTGRRAADAVARFLGEGGEG